MQDDPSAKLCFSVNAAACFACFWPQDKLLHIHTWITMSYKTKLWTVFYLSGFGNAYWCSSFLYLLTLWSGGFWFQSICENLPVLGEMQVFCFSVRLQMVALFFCPSCDSPWVSMCLSCCKAELGVGSWQDQGPEDRKQCRKAFPAVIHRLHRF